MINDKLLVNINNLLNCGLKDFDKENIKAGNYKTMYFDSDNWCLFIISPFACIRYFGLYDDEENKIRIATEQKKIHEKPIKTSKGIWDDYEFSMQLKPCACGRTYCEERTEQITISELKKYIREEKAKPEWKKKSNKRVLRRKYDTLHDAVLLQRAIQCIVKSEKEKAILYYGNDRLKPLFIKGSLGDSFILPNRW